jgi:dTDP-4-dehydrorhamnose 3,5-epimerase
MTNVDACELHPDDAAEVNGAGARRVAAAAGRHGARTVFLSTDYVFDGMKSGEYSEDDAPCPINVYGRSKLAGERAVLEADPRNLVVRTSWVYGEGRNFIRTIRGAAADGRTLRVVDDQVGRPTAAVDIAVALKHLIACEARGIVNITGAGDPCSWADLAEVVIGGTVARISTEEFGAPAPRPANSVLSLDRAATLGVPLRDWRSAVDEYLESAA